MKNDESKEKYWVLPIISGDTSTPVEYSKLVELDTNDSLDELPLRYLRETLSVELSGNLVSKVVLYVRKVKDFPAELNQFELGNSNIILGYNGGDIF